MSTRHLKKVLSNALLKEKKQDNSEQEVSDVEVRSEKQKNFNVFDLVRQIRVTSNKVIFIDKVLLKYFIAER